MRSMGIDGVNDAMPVVVAAVTAYINDQTLSSKPFYAFKLRIRRYNSDLLIKTILNKLGINIAIDALSHL